MEQFHQVSADKDSVGAYVSQSFVQYFSLSALTVWCKVVSMLYLADSDPPTSQDK
jgi:hypothetical protein